MNSNFALIGEGGANEILKEKMVCGVKVNFDIGNIFCILNTQSLGKTMPQPPKNLLVFF